MNPTYTSFIGEHSEKKTLCLYI